MNDEIYLPTLEFWLHENEWSGSRKNLRYWITPKKDEAVFHVEYWPGPMCREKRPGVEETDFPLNEEGLEEIKGWILSEAEHFSVPAEGAGA